MGLSVVIQSSLRGELALCIHGSVLAPACCWIVSFAQPILPCKSKCFHSLLQWTGWRPRTGRAFMGGWWRTLSQHDRDESVVQKMHKQPCQWLLQAPMKWLSYFQHLIRVELDISRQPDGQIFQWPRITLQIVVQTFTPQYRFLTPQYRLGMILTARNFGALMPTTHPSYPSPL